MATETAIRSPARSDVPNAAAVFCPEEKTTNGNLYRVWRCSKATLEGKLHTDAKGDTMGCDVGRQVREDVALDILRRSVQTV